MNTKMHASSSASIALMLMLALSTACSDAPSSQSIPSIPPLPTTERIIVPYGWLGGSATYYRQGLDFADYHSGLASAFIESLGAPASSAFGQLTQGIRADAYRGGRIRLTAYVESSNVRGAAGLWMRVDSPTSAESFDNMARRPVTGTTAWKPYSIVLNVPTDASVIYFGALLSGTGSMHMDDFQLDVVDDTVPLTGDNNIQSPSSGGDATHLATAPVNLGFDAPANAPVAASSESWLAANTVNVRTVDPADTNFSDLAPLEAAIGSARVVMLGEESHGDGTAFQAKVRLIKFLHERMGFGVVVFEAGLFDCNEAWKKIVAGVDPLDAAGASIFQLWSQSAQVAPLFTYIGAQLHSVHPLILAGIDPQFTGPGAAGSGATFVSTLESYLASQSSPILADSSWPAFRAVTDSLSRRYYETMKSTAPERNAFARGSALLIAETARLRDTRPSDETRFWAQIATSLDSYGRGVWEFDSTGVVDLGYNVIRDSAMARNLIWTASTRYPNDKIVVWMHSEHIDADPAGMFDPFGGRPLAGWATTGYLTRLALGDAMYSIGFLAGSGSWQLAQPGAPPATSFPAASAGSWDDLFLQTAKPYAFLDMRHPAAGGDWIKTPRFARPFFYAPDYGDWSKAFDAWFFTAVMAPSTPR